jgi:putative DNA primase/helicase
MSGAAFTPDPSLPSILELAKKLWGEPTDWSADKNEVRFGANGSKSIKIRECVWQDHEANEGGGYLEIYRKAEGALPPRKAGNGHDKTYDGPKPWLDIGTIYRYVNEIGGLVLEVIRTKSGKPRFRQRKPDASKPFGWDWKTRDIPYARRPLYRLPQLLAADETDLVFITEGEKDADNLASRGLIATTNSGGAGKWCPEYAEMFRGKHVVVLPDNDPAGEGHIRVVASSVHGVAASLRVLALPGLGHKGDVSDWLAAGGTAGGLQRLALEAPLWVPPQLPPPPPPPGGPGGGSGGAGSPPWDGEEEPPTPPLPPGGPRPVPEGMPVITCVEGELDRMVRQAQAALLNSGLPIYQRGILVQPVEQQYQATDGSVTHSATLVEITAPSLYLMMGRSAVYQKPDARTSTGWRVCNPPKDLVQVVLHNRGGWPFPHVRGVLTCPTLRPDGSLLALEGYDPASRYYLMFPTDLALPDIPDFPGKAEARESLARLKGLLGSYPFVNRASRSVALAMLMTQVLRCAMPVSPMLAVSARAPGTGKSHLVDLASTVAIGRLCPSMGVGARNEEVEKEINTMLLSGVSGFSIDNISRDLDIPTLNRATERPMVTIRLFGTLTNVEVENAATIYATGNNLAIVDEQGRRTMRCELDANRERPERRVFDGDPIATVRQNRGRYLVDILVIARAYHLSGEAAGEFPIGSYGAWSHFVREPLIWLEEADPADTMEQAAKDDPSTLRLHALVIGWWGSFGLSSKTLADAARDAQPEYRDTLKEHFPARGGVEIDTTRMGNWLRKFTGRVVKFEDYRPINVRFAKEEGHTGGAIRWKLEEVEEEG